MSFKISHLVTVGCSFTYCQGLEKPHEQGWPRLLADRLGVPIVNLGIGGSGNDSIYRRTIEYFYKDLSNNNHPFYVIALSHATRREEWFKYHQGIEVNEFLGLDMGASAADLVDSASKEKFDNIDSFSKSYVIHLDYNIVERKKHINWASINQLFSCYNINNMIGDYMPTYDEDPVKFVKESYSNLYYYNVKNKNFVGDLATLTRAIPKLPCGHDNLESMSIISDHFYKNMIEQYGLPEVVNEPFVKARDYFPKHSGRTHTYNTWVQNF